MPESPAELRPEQLYTRCDPDSLPADTTADMDPGIGIIGQPRAADAIGFALGMTADGYNLFVAGEPGTGRNTSIRIAVEEAARERPVPDDWCYVHNFDQPDAPRALRLPSGKGCELQEAMEALIEELKEGIPKAFEGRAYEERRARLLKELQERREEQLEKFKSEASERGFTVEQSGGGVLTLPTKNGKPMSSSDWEELTEEEKEDLETRQEDLQQVMRDITRLVRDMEKDARKRLQDLEREVALHPVGSAIDEIRERYGEFPDVLTYLRAVREDILANLEDFKDDNEQQMPIPGFRIARNGDPLTRYQVNVIIDNGGLKGAPVIFESHPTFYNLVGRQEYRSSMGTLTTDFTMIKAGALHRANGGYLVLQAMDVLRNPMSWDALKRAIRDREVVLEDLNEQFRVIQTQGLKPEPVPLEVKILLVGSPMLYILLYQYEEDFRKIFKVKADFGLMMDREEASLSDYAGFIASRVHAEGLRHMDRTAMARVVEHGSRLVSDQGRLSTRFVEIADLIRESDYWAGQAGSDLVGREHVDRAIEQKVYRSNRIEERLQKMIEEGTILVDTEGEAEGQINGLAVLSLGDYQFGKPSRLTARVFAGKAGIIQIDRDTDLAGNIHNKGILILQGFFGERYAGDEPVALSASLAFEQMYDGVDGDSASSTELYSLLSALARVPLRQDLAVTGSVNQNGVVQAIGGVNEKIEGWFHTCRLKGFTGNQGVLIPASNVRHLMLKQEVVDAVAAGTFHIYPIRHIDEGIAVLTGIPAGTRMEDGSWTVGSINYRVQKRLESLAEGLRRSALGPGNHNRPRSSH